jgi:hypothetical protein
VRITNPEVRLVPDGPLAVSQDKPFVLAPPEPLRLEQGHISVKVEPQHMLPPVSDQLPRQSAGGDVIKREVTVFSTVSHGPGAVVTGWSYKDGSGGVPIGQFCYYTSRSEDQSIRRVDMAFDRVKQMQIGMDLVPEVDAAFSKCQWWES